ncbi:uncharacterized protein LOC126779524 isoform X2 [Nymphalis io]|uniref:uncharacterized protein LOC126779524 isoform X2 n=1 Tax=Inachis io TaxID=171585 RepID=UPI002167991D|nr:uncharacterized protein LOC126779524 isoform X2 [Nymphalis io]
MSTTKFRFILRDLGMMRLWSAWTHKYIFSSVVRRCIRDRGVREVIQRFRHTILRPKRTLLLSATAAYKSHDDSFSCDQGISDGELQDLVLELENAQNLVKMTMYCTSCGKRLVIDRKQSDVIYCGCKAPTSQSDSSDGWVPYMEANDVIIWRKEYKPGKGLYAYKVYGRYPEVVASDFAAVQIDGAYRRAWDSAVAALAVVQRDARGVPGQAVLHWEVLWPRLFANRDYVYIRRHKEFDITIKNKTKTPETPLQTFETSVHAKAKRKSIESYAIDKDGDIKNKVYIIVSKSCEHPDVPETKHAIRVAEYWSHMVVKSLEGTDKPGMEFVLTYYDEPCVGGMPGGVAAWASSRAAPAYLQRMRRAAYDYRGWAAHRPKQSSKLGPEMENVTTREQGSQTEEFLIKNYCINSDEIVKNELQDKKNDGKGDEQKNSEVTIQTNGKNTSKSDKDASGVQEGDSEKAPEEENNGGWWRYLYPFYYFV